MGKFPTLRPSRRRQAKQLDYQTCESRRLLSASEGGFLVNSAADTGAVGTLRWAIEMANADPDLSTIDFDLPADTTIDLQSALPNITEPVQIDASGVTGYSGSPLVNIDGSAAGVNVDGLFIRGENTVVRGLAFVGFEGDGIEISNVDGVLLSEVYVGVRSDGGVQGVGRHGVRISNSDFANVVDSLVSGSGLEGVFADAHANNTLILGNKIGTDAAGIGAVGNTRNGVVLLSSNNEVRANVIAANGMSGISMHNRPGGDNVIAGNRIGLAANGQALGNGIFGIVTNSANNRIGGVNPGDGNQIGGNTRQGILLRRADFTTIEQNMIGVNDADEAVGNGFGGIRVLGSNALFVADNVISANNGPGVFLGGELTAASVLFNNLIGTNLTGLTDMGNAGPGLIQNASTDGIIQGNTISGNDNGGVFSVGGDLFNNYRGNNIGVAVDGSTRLDNTGTAMYMISSSNQIGENGSGNTFSSTGVSVVLRGGMFNTVNYNYFGTDASMTVDNSHSFGMNIVISATNNLIFRNVFDNLHAGIRNRSGATGNTYYENSMHDVTIGIDNGPSGLQPNDSGDDDFGPNNMQNSPDLSAAQLVGGVLTVEYFVDTSGLNGASPMVIEFYLEGNAQVGQTYLGDASFAEEDWLAGLPIAAEINVDGQLEVGDRIVATATDAEGNTSEFSLGFDVT